MYSVQDIREEFIKLHDLGEERNGTLEIQACQFIANEPTIFGEVNEEYVEAELEWYRSSSRNVYDLFKIYGKEVKIWKDIADANGFINSNYGWCIYSPANHSQYNRVRECLEKDPFSRHGVMYYTRPSMHSCQNAGGMRDHMCTFSVQYHINDGNLDAHVYMRSNDAIFGYNNDYAWQRHVLEHLARDLNKWPGQIIWHASSMHVYSRHYHLVR